MSLPETIWFCQPHNKGFELPAGDTPHGFCEISAAIDYEEACDLVALRVAGRDDLLIRREVVEAWLRMANNGEIFDLEYHLERPRRSPKARACRLRRTANGAVAPGSWEGIGWATAGVTTYTPTRSVTAPGGMTNERVPQHRETP